MKKKYLYNDPAFRCSRFHDSMFSHSMLFYFPNAFWSLKISKRKKGKAVVLGLIILVIIIIITFVDILRFQWNGEPTLLVQCLF